jgi:hypothetical protein
MTALPSLNFKVSKRLEKLAKLYESGQVSAATARAVDKMLAYETRQSRHLLIETERDLSTYETKYKMATAKFMKRYQSGKTDDRMDFVERASLAQMADNLRQRIQALKNQP